MSSQAATKPLPRIALLGDSIRCSYQAKVSELLAGRAEIVYPAENSRYSLYSLERAAEWFAAFGKVDAVHWNNGLWDCGYCPYRSPRQFAVTDYAFHLKTLLGYIRSTYAPGARIIWATTTPSHPDRAFSETAWSWYAEDIKRYNAAALEIMLGEGVQVNDLFAVVSPDLDRFLAEDKLHLSPAGVDACAHAVVSALVRSGVVNN